MVPNSGFFNNTGIMKWKLLLVLGFAIELGSAYCFTPTIKGRVVESNTQTPLPKASVSIPELALQIQVKEDGSFVLSLPDGHNTFWMEIRCAGFESRFVQVGQDSVLGDVPLFKTAIRLQEVQVRGGIFQSPRALSQSIVRLEARESMESGAASLTDALTRIPGVGQLATGPGIGKPVVRGLYGNRIQVNLLGLLFDHQQWQDEHGLGLSDLSALPVELIRGPSSLLYGGDAMGGVINLLPSPTPTEEGLKQDLMVRLHHNTVGVSGAYGRQKRTGDTWRLWRITADNQGDGIQGDGKRLLNSRNSLYTFRHQFGTRRARYLMQRHVYFSFNQAGFVFDSIARIIPDNRFSRRLDGPHHNVAVGLFSQEHTWIMHVGRLRLNWGWVGNQRLEQETGNKISLNMLLNTISGRLLYVRPLGLRHQLSLGVSAMGQLNRNMGARVIIPDAFNSETALFGLWEWHKGPLYAEAGMRLDWRYAQTWITSPISSPGRGLDPFARNRIAGNTSVGLVYEVLENLRVRTNLSSGYRVPNLAEWSSNGLHEGTIRWEIGDPNLNIEQNLNTEIGILYELGEELDLQANVYRNAFQNFIYLSPTGSDFRGFPIFVFRQGNAQMKGVEAQAKLHLHEIPWLELQTAYSQTQGMLQSGEYVPFIPANRLQSSMRVQTRASHKGINWFARLDHQWCQAQNQVGPFERSTPAYQLLHAALGWEQTKGSITRKILVSVQNLLNLSYSDHLYRLRYFGFLNAGRSIQISFQTTF